MCVWWSPPPSLIDDWARQAYEMAVESWGIFWWILTKWDIWWIMKNLLMDLDEMRYLMNHEESPDGSWRNEISDESWRISWWILTKWDIWWIMKNLLMDLDEMRYLMNHEESPDGSWRNEISVCVCVLNHECYLMLQEMDQPRSRPKRPTEAYNSITPNETQRKTQLTIG